MEQLQRIGVVVVGLGRAGRVRLRDLMEATAPELQGVHLVGYVSKRKVEIEGAQQIEMEAALANPDVKAVFVCTENKRHEELARQCLEAGKHVLVEYPLALTRAGAEGLFALAKRKGVVLHEEEIGLLLHSNQILMKRVSEAGPLVSADYTKTAGINWWIANMADSGSPFVSSISTLHLMVSLFGELTPRDACIRATETGIESWATLLTKENKPVHVRINRMNDPDTKRSTSYQFSFEGGVVIDNVNLNAEGGPEVPSSPYGLFMQDFIMFIDTVRGRRDATAYNQRALHCLDLTDKILELAKQNKHSQL